MSAQGLAVGAIVVLLTLVILALLARTAPKAPGSSKDLYSAGYQISPHLLGPSTWAGTPYVLTPMRTNEEACPLPAEYRKVGGTALASEESPRGGPHAKESFYPFAPADAGRPGPPREAPNLIYKPAATANLRGDHPDWWQPDGGTYGLPVAADRPNFWAGDATIHTYRARTPIPPLCEPGAVVDNRRRLTPREWIEKWRYYGGAKGWTMSPYY
jgi:hypothetical protein